MLLDFSQLRMHRPKSLPEALTYLANAGEQWRPFAGGTDLMVQLHAGKFASLPGKGAASCNFLDISGLVELTDITEEQDYWRLGALTTYAEILANGPFSAAYPNLAAASELTGARAIQTRGTIGGNIANASPAADSVPALLSYGASIEIISATMGERIVPLDQFYRGYKELDLGPGELIQGVRLPKLKGDENHFFRKVGTRRAQAISKVVVAGLLGLENGRIAKINLSLGAAAPTAIIAKTASKWFLGQKPGEIDQAILAENLLRDISPIDDIRSTSRYRRDVVVNLVHHWLTGSQ